MGYSLGLLPGPHDPSTQRLPRHVTSLAAISHSAKPSVQHRPNEQSAHVVTTPVTRKRESMQLRSGKRRRVVISEILLRGTLPPPRRGVAILWLEEAQTRAPRSASQSRV